MENSSSSLHFLHPKCDQKWVEERKKFSFGKGRNYAFQETLNGGVGRSLKKIKSGEDGGGGCTTT